MGAATFTRRFHAALGLRRTGTSLLRGDWVGVRGFHPGQVFNLNEDGLVNGFPAPIEFSGGLISLHLITMNASIGGVIREAGAIHHLFHAGKYWIQMKIDW